MIFINEWLPNPNGADAKGEFIELFNNGNAPVNLDGWALRTTGKKIFPLGGRIVAAKGYLVLDHATTKLTLKNTGETISLYDAAGHLIDQSAYLGAAPSGKSFSRVYYPAGDDDASGGGDVAARAAQPQSFAWTIPTPGVANNVALHNGVSVTSYPAGVSLDGGPVAAADVFGMAIGLGAILAVFVIYFLRTNENFANLFFPRDRADRL